MDDAALSFAKFKALLRTAAPQTATALSGTIGTALNAFSLAEWGKQSLRIPFQPPPLPRQRNSFG
jgi:hypothetical protein